MTQKVIHIHLQDQTKSVEVGEIILIANDHRNDLLTSTGGSSP